MTYRIETAEAGTCNYYILGEGQSYLPARDFFRDYSKLFPNNKVKFSEILPNGNEKILTLTSGVLSKDRRK